jgi:hypothetical protein
MPTTPSIVFVDVARSAGAIPGASSNADSGGLGNWRIESAMPAEGLME